MINLDKITINTCCPKCRFLNKVTLKQARLQDAVICRGCKSNIQLQDHMNTVRKTTREIDRQLHALQDAIEGLGKKQITINL